MAAEIRIPFEEFAHPITNNRARRKLFRLTNNIVMPPAWVCRASEHAGIIIYLPIIPPEIKASTPAGKLRIKWVTALTDTTNAAKFFCKLRVVNPDDAASSYDPSGADFTAHLDSSVTDISKGAGDPNECELAIPDAMLASVQGKELIGLITRNDSDAGDTLAGEIGIVKTYFVADKA